MGLSIVQIEGWGLERPWKEKGSKVWKSRHTHSKEDAHPCATQEIPWKSRPQTLLYQEHDAPSIRTHMREMPRGPYAELRNKKIHGQSPHNMPVALE